MSSGRFSLQRGALCVAVAALLPLPSAVSTSAGPPSGAAPVADQSSASSAAASSLVRVDVPPLVRSGRQDKTTASKHAKHRKRITIRASQHERVLEISANTSYDVPLAALNAYKNAAGRAASSYPGCHLSWGVIAAIGQVESNHGRFGGASVLANGVTTPRIVGLALNGHGVARIADTDNGALDGDKVWDRAVGPMQFIPSTWAVIGADGDGNGHRNPSDFDDAALTTALYLCSAGGDFSSLSQARANVLRYNHSDEYVDLVLTIANAYDSGVVDVVAPRARPVDPPRPPPDATRAELPAEVALHGHDFREAEHEEGQVDQVDPDVEERPVACQVAVREPAPVPRNAVLADHLDVGEIHLAEIAPRHRVAHRERRAIESLVLVDAEQLAARARGNDHCLGTGAPHAHRLLAEDVLTGLERGDCHWRMQRVRQGDRDEIEVGASQKLLRCGIDRSDVEAPRDVESASAVRIADGADLDTRGEQRRDVALLGDAAASDDSCP